MREEEELRKENELSASFAKAHIHEKLKDTVDATEEDNEDELEDQSSLKQQLIYTDYGGRDRFARSFRLIFTLP